MLPGCPAPLFNIQHISLSSADWHIVVTISLVFDSFTETVLSQSFCSSSRTFPVSFLVLTNLK